MTHAVTISDCEHLVDLVHPPVNWRHWINIWTCSVYQMREHTYVCRSCDRIQTMSELTDMLGIYGRWMVWGLGYFKTSPSPNRASVEWRVNVFTRERRHQPLHSRPHLSQIIRQISTEHELTHIVCIFVFLSLKLTDKHFRFICPIAADNGIPTRIWHGILCVLIQC